MRSLACTRRPLGVPAKPRPGGGVRKRRPPPPSPGRLAAEQIAPGAKPGSSESGDLGFQRHDGDPESKPFRPAETLGTALSSSDGASRWIPGPPPRNTAVEHKRTCFPPQGGLGARPPPAGGRWRHTALPSGAPKRFLPSSEAATLLSTGQIDFCCVVLQIFFPVLGIEPCIFTLSYIPALYYIFFF